MGPDLLAREIAATQALATKADAREHFVQTQTTEQENPRETKKSKVCKSTCAKQNAIAKKARNDAFQTSYPTQVDRVSSKGTLWYTI
jgi:hypothetical protein